MMIKKIKERYKLIPGTRQSKDKTNLWDRGKYFTTPNILMCAQATQDIPMCVT